MTPDLSSPSDSALIPTAFIRHHRRLRALLIERQPWFVARDLARLINSHLTDRVIQRLDDDQYRDAVLRTERGECAKELLISESGVYALLMVNFYHPENRSLRQWLSNEVVPALKEARQHSQPSPPAQAPVSHGFIPLEITSQHSTRPHEATLYLHKSAAPDALYDAAEYRLKSVIEMLSALHVGDPEDNPFCSISRSLLLLISDAQSLYQADHERKRGR
ncbi:Bro-N domain-containing protein [Pseudomonas knackmussii]|uniref:BRO-N domain-containing protein n=1 Tax=Pseudomonas knackmussii TaxID=65741 RepID=UPI003BCD418E